MKNKSCIFGPVPSRRLGFSLGVDIVPFKTCSLDCVYCQLGPTTVKTLERKEYLPVEEVLSELEGVLKKGGRIDWITFSGSGEPTLNARIGEMIGRIKKITNVPVAVLTNGTLLYEKSVREEIKGADLVIPSIDAGTEAVFRKVNRPHPDLSLEKVVKGIADFKKGFSGKIWLEVMLVKGINDSESEMEEIARYIRIIKPERVQLNTVVRPPAEEYARGLNSGEMEKAVLFLRERLGKIPVEVVVEFRGEREKVMKEDVQTAIVNYLKRRPATLHDLSATLGLHRNEVVKYLTRLLKSGRVTERYSGKKKYFIFKK